MLHNMVLWISPLLALYGACQLVFDESIFQKDICSWTDEIKNGKSTANANLLAQLKMYTLFWVLMYLASVCTHGLWYMWFFLH